MSWQDHLKMYLVEEFGEEQGTAINENFSNAFSPGYRDDFLPRTAIEDIKKIATLGNGDDIAMSFYRKGDRADNALSFRLYHLGTPLTLSDVMPILENLGLRVESEHPYAVKCKDGKYIWIDEFSLTFKSTFDIDFNKVGEAFQEAFLHIWNGSAESDAFNKLIIGVELDWREVAMLRAYARYMKQIKLGFSGDYIAETLAAHKGITASIVELFYASFDCKDIEDEKREEKIDQIEQSIIESLDGVENLSEDRVIRYYLAVIKATLRTNYFQRDSQGEFKNYFSFKLSPKQIPEVPLPVPLFEIFVYSPQVEGVHLRGGKVARGGLRWSDRQEDFRTEVLGLVKAQQVKNSVIVPMGAKGGFVLKHPPTEREELQAEGIRCYKIFIQALLDITDNLVDGQVIPPHSVVRRDEDDIYLVVAADKGTATFSDIVVFPT
jgi:glutamate dehydrogenase